MSDEPRTWRVGPLLFWRGRTSPAKPWPRIRYTTLTGYVLCIEGLTFGVVRTRRPTPVPSKEEE